jgi:RNA polymerase sigma-54 factor
MRQGLSILQMPLLELKKYLNDEVEQNPLLEWKEDLSYEEKYSFPKQFLSRNHREEMEAIPKKESLVAKISQQINEVFSSGEEKTIANHLLGNLDEKGFLSAKVEEIAKCAHTEEAKVEKISKIMHTFEPSGIGCTTLQEYLLLQLKMEQMESSFAYRIIENHYSSLIHCQFSKIEKALKISKEELAQVIQKDLRPLKFSPIDDPSSKSAPSLLPDFFLWKEGKRWIFRYQSESKLTIRTDYLQTISSISKEEKSQMKIFLKKAMDLTRGLSERKKTLKKIALYLLKKQLSFFEENKELECLTIKQMASDLGLHPSTAARAIAHKYLASPQGIFPLRFFFSRSVKTVGGKEVSQQKAKLILKALIQEEDKKHPFSDEALASLMKKAGISLARRTIVKYRKELSIQTASRRRAIFALSML